MSNYEQLTEAELRNYVKQHPDDEKCFSTLFNNYESKT